VETMPVGIGQLLDQTLMSGEMDVDQYAMQMSRLAETYSEMSHDVEGEPKR